MSLRTGFSLVLTVLILASCAAKEEIIKQPEPVPTEAEEVFQLPEPEPEPEPEVKKPKFLEPVLIESGEEEKYILLNFDETDIQTIISTFGELLHINYILTPGISGRVTIQSYNKFPVKDLFQVFQSILEINGLTAVESGGFYKVVPIDTAKQQPVDVERGREVEYRLDSSFITQLVPLEYVKASEMANILRTLMPRGTDLIVYEPANMLVVTSLPPTLAKFMKLIEALDIPDSETEGVRTFVYYVENGQAKKLEEILNSIYADSKSTRPAGARTAPVTTRTARRTTTTPTTVRQALPGEIGEISITAYEDINALIIKTSPRAYLSLLEVLKRIDVPPRQVLIEVMIFEVTLGDSFEFGLEWLIKSGSGDIFGLNLSGIKVPPEQPLFPAGNLAAVITGSAGSSTFNAVITALATQSKLNVMASPHILATDNKEAKIEIGDEIPIATGLTQQPSTGGTSTTLISSGQIQYKTVGTLLNVKPRITEKDMVTLEITQEQSQLGPKVPVAGQEFQGFSTRKATTTATVKSGHTLVLGGLISESTNKSRSGVPFLSKIPLLGYLFSSSSDSHDKTELLVMVTPHVVSNQDDADAITEEFQNKVKTIKKRIEKIEKMKMKGKDEETENPPDETPEETTEETTQEET